MERRNFLKSAVVGVAAGLVATEAVAQVTPKPKRAESDKIKLGVSLYSYSAALGYVVTLEDCFADMYDTGSSCFEALSSHIEGYPNPSTKWIDHFFKLCEKYSLQPAELGIWAETHLRRGPRLSDDEVVAQVTRDLKLANLLGFNSVRLKLTTLNALNDPEPGWQSYLERLLPIAEKYDVAMLNEVHRPTKLTRQHVNDYMEFAEKHKSKYFAMNVDFGTFQNFVLPRDQSGQTLGNAEPLPRDSYSMPEDIVRFLATSRTCHAKFNNMNENFEEVTIPYGPVLQIMKEHGWNGQLVSEYEGPRKNDMAYVGDQLRRQHIMMRRILGY